MNYETITLPLMEAAPRATHAYYATAPIAPPAPAPPPPVAGTQAH